jgi:putative endonuclease
MIATREKGNIGEDIACAFLQNNGFTIICRNYLRKWGEIDIVAKQGNELHFFEVKSSSMLLKVASNHRKWSYRPEENVHDLKIHRLRKIIQTYLAEKAIGSEDPFFTHILCVFFDEKKRRARIKWIKNVIL